MFKKAKPVERTEQQSANRRVNRLLTFALVLFILYNMASHDKKPGLPHFSFMAENFTPIKLPPVVEVKNLDNGTTSVYTANDNSLNLKGNNVVTIIP